MTIIKYATINLSNIDTAQISEEAALADDKVTERFKKVAKEIFRVAPKAADFLYFQCVMLHAAEASLVDQDTGKPLLNKKGEPLAGGFDDKWKWFCNDEDVKPYKNQNGDIFGERALLKENDAGMPAYAGWTSAPLARDHKADSVSDILGIIVDTYYDPVRKRVIGLCALDKKNYPEIAHKVKSGYANSVSMGCACGGSICYDCNNLATTEAEYCNCVKGKTTYGEINIELAPLELSLVVSPADKLARIKTVIASMNDYTEKKEQQIMKDSTCITASELNDTKKQMNDLKDQLESLIDTLKSEEQDSQGGAGRSSAQMHGGEHNTGYGSRDTESANTFLPTWVQDQARLNMIANVKTADINDTNKSLESLYARIKNLEKQINEKVGSYLKEDKMTKDELRKRAEARRKLWQKSAYFQGGGDENEPTPGKPKYPVEPYKQIWDQDKQMVGEGLEPGADGMMGDDEKLKEMLHRAKLEDRKLRREALVKGAGDWKPAGQTQSGGKLYENTASGEVVENKADTGEFTLDAGEFAADLFNEDQAVADAFESDDFDSDDMDAEDFSSADFSSDDDDYILELDDQLFDELTNIKAAAIVSLAKKKGAKPSKPKKPKYKKKPKQNKDQDDKSFAKEMKSYEKDCKKLDKQFAADEKAYAKAMDKMEKDEKKAKKDKASDDKKKKASRRREMNVKRSYFFGGGDENEPSPAGNAKYPVEPYTQYRDQDKHMSGQGMEPGADGMMGDDERLKEGLKRATLKARLKKLANTDGELDKDSSYWTLLADDKEVLTASGKEAYEDEIEANWDWFSSKEYGEQILRAAYGDGVSKLSLALKGVDITKKAQAEMLEEPAAPADMAPMEEAPAEEPAAEEPAEEALPSGDMTDTTKNKIEDVSAKLSEAKDALDKLLGEAEAEEEVAAAGEEGEIEQALQLKSKLNDHMKVVYSDVANLVEKLRSPEKLLKNSSFVEVDSLLSFANDVAEEAEFTIDIANRTEDHIGPQPGLRDEIETLAQGLGILERGFESEEDVEVEFSADDFRVEAKEECKCKEKCKECKECKDCGDCKCKEESKCDDGAVQAASEALEARKAWRDNVAKRIVAQSLQGPTSDKLREAHPGGGTTVGDVSPAANNMLHVEDLEEAHSQDLAAATSSPTGKQGAKAGAKLNKSAEEGEGKSSYSEDGTDYWASYFGEAGEAAYGKQMGQKFASSEEAQKLVAEFSEMKEKESLNKQAVKIRRCYALAKEMADKGMMPNTADAFDSKVDEMLNFDDAAFESFKRVVSSTVRPTSKANMGKSINAALNVGLTPDKGSEDSDVDLSKLWS